MRFLKDLFTLNFNGPWLSFLFTKYSIYLHYSIGHSYRLYIWIYTYSYVWCILVSALNKERSISKGRSIHPEDDEYSMPYSHYIIFYTEMQLIYNVLNVWVNKHSICRTPNVLWVQLFECLCYWKFYCMLHATYNFIILRIFLALLMLDILE